MPTSVPAPDRVPARLGDFDIVGVLGQGGSGVVYDARWGHREVALKVLHPALVATDKEREQFLGEARRLADIAHPGVVKVLAVGELSDGRPYLAMEKLAGETLAARLGRGPLGAERALRLFGQLADAVAALHDRGLVHRDLKPENVVLVGGGDGEAAHAVLLDFGIAKELAAPASTTTQDGGVRGTPAYMAPERFFGSPASVSTDVYELAVVLFAMLAGRLPWDDCGDPALRLNPLRLADAAPGVPDPLDALIARALSTRAGNRPPSVRATLEAVLAATGQVPAVGPRATADLRALPTPPEPQAWFERSTAPGRPGQADRRRRRWPWLVGAAAVVAAGGLAITLLASRRARDALGPVADDPWAATRAAAPPAARAPAPPPAAAPVHPDAGARVPPPSTRPLRKELAAALGHFAPGTQAVVGLVVDELRQNRDLSALILAAPNTGLLTAYLHISGCDLDFLRDTDWIAVGVARGGKATDAIVSGRWSRDAIEACLGGARRSDILHVKGPGGAVLTRLHGGQGDRWLAWIDERTFVISTRADAGKAWMAARVNRTDGPGGVAGKLAAGLDLDATGWVVADADSMRTSELSPDIPPADLSARAVLTGGLDVELRFGYPTEAQATQVAAVIDKKADELVGGPAMRKMLGNIQVEREGTDVVARGSLSAELLHAAAMSAARDAGKK
jgi:predicted Ser/Thr protein kinase